MWRPQWFKISEYKSMLVVSDEGIVLVNCVKFALSRLLRIIASGVEISIIGVIYRLSGCMISHDDFVRDLNLGWMVGTLVSGGGLLLRCGEGCLIWTGVLLGRCFRF